MELKILKPYHMSFACVCVCVGGGLWKGRKILGDTGSTVALPNLLPDSLNWALAKGCMHDPLPLV